MRDRLWRASLLGALAAALGLAAPALGAHLGSGYVGSLLAQTPTDETVPTPACSFYSHSTASEEARRDPAAPGLDPAHAWSNALRPPRVLGYLDRTTAQCGDEVGVHLAGTGRAVISAYRVGWYGGAGTRLVWTSQPVATRPRPYASMDPATRMMETSWPRSASIRVQPDWTPGMYLLVATPVGRPPVVGMGNIMPLVVQDDAGGPLLAVASTLTWAAYNPYGGRSTYSGPGIGRDEATRSLVASLDRPLTGSGLRHLLVYDVPLARFFGRAGIDAEWTTDDQLDTQPGMVAAHTAVVFPGHSEYWTDRMYDAVEAGRNHGVNVAFLGADPVYWQSRLVASPLGPRRRLVIFREAALDPDATDQPDRATVRWRDQPVGRDEAELVGTTYAAAGVRAGMQVQDAPSWLLDGTGLSSGSALVDAAANEVDTFSSAARAAPPNLQVVLRGAYQTPGGTLGDFASTYYTVPGGGAVFAAGTTAWPCGLEDSCPFGPVPGATSTALRQLTVNVVTAFLTKGFAVSHPSQPSAAAPLPQFWRQLPAELRGTGGFHRPGGLDED